MKKEDAIKYLQQLYPNGGHCWLDEQRIEAIGMAVKALQEEPVSDNFENALAEEWKGYNDRGAAKVDALEDNTQELAFAKGFYRGANWQKQQDQSTIELAEDHAYFAGRTKTIDEMMEKAVETTFNVSLPSGLYDKLWVKGCKEGDKLLVIKKDEL